MKQPNSKQTLIRELLKIPYSSMKQRIEHEVNENPALESKDAPISQVAEYEEQELHARPSLQEYLQQQLQGGFKDQRQKQLITHILGTIDSFGYIRRELEMIQYDLQFKGFQTDEVELESLLKIIQTCKPAGVGARNLRECLLIQIERRIQENKEELRHRYLLIARQILSRGFKEFSKKYFDKLLQKFGITLLELKEAISEIQKLNPKPCTSYNSDNSTQLDNEPDFIFTNNYGNVSVEINEKNFPQLSINPEYKGMLKEYQSKPDKDRATQQTINFISQRIKKAEKFIEALEKRKNILLKIGTAILNYQIDYLQTGDESKIKPMAQKSIADDTQYHVATVSRALFEKTVQTEYGICEAKYLFSETINKNDGEGVSALEVRNFMMEIIKKEDKIKPLSDEKLKKLLYEKGYKVSRRTVVNYRQMLNIPVARLRKSLT